MRVSKVELVALALLASGPAYGYELLERASSMRMALWAGFGRASLYQALDRLERRGAIRGRAVDGAAGPDRHVATLTRAGRSLLQEGIAERLGVSQPYGTDSAIAAGLAALGTPASSTRALAAHERGLRVALAELADARAATTDEVSQAMLERQEALVMADLAWVRGRRNARPRGR